MAKTKSKEVKLTKAGKPRKKPGRPPSKKKLYFGPEVQDAIIRYNQSEKPSERNKIYGEEIHKAFDKLAENIINTFKFTYFDDGFEDVKHEVVAFLVMNMHKWDHTKGSKAFSYFSIVAKNYLILHNNNNYKKYKSHDAITALDKSRNLTEQHIDYDDFLIELCRYFEEKIPTLFKRKKDLDIAYAILELMERRHEIENFNKKALYILIREMTNVETTSITKVANVLKKHYKVVANRYYKSGMVNPPKSELKEKFF
jgi:hypothetical protein